MSRTVRRKRNGRGQVRDGADQHVDRSCGNHGGCPYCEGNRMHSTHKREPVEEVNFDLERMEKAIHGPFYRCPEGLSREEFRAWMLDPNKKPIGEDGEE